MSDQKYRLDRIMLPDSFDDDKTEPYQRSVVVECYICGRKGPRIGYDILPRHGASVCPSCVEWQV